MSVENVLTFIKDLAESEPEVLRDLLESEPEAVVAAAKERGVTLELDDVIRAGAMMQDAIQQAENIGPDGELEEEALEAVSGGILFAAIGAAASVLGAAHTMSGGKSTNVIGKGLSTAGNAVGSVAKKIFKGW